MFKKFIASVGLASALVFSTPAVSDPGHLNLVANIPVVLQPTLCRTFEAAMDVVGTNFEKSFEESLKVLRALEMQGVCLNVPQPVYVIPLVVAFEQDGIMIVEVASRVGGEPTYMLLKGNAMFFPTAQDLDAHNSTEASN
jgi:hypothetical protein